MINKFILLSLVLVYSILYPALGLTSNSEIQVQNCTLRTIETRIAQNKLLAEFHQAKFISTLTKPLSSQGNLLLVQDKGLIWQTQKPIKSTSVITDDGIAQYNLRDQKSSLTQNMANESGKQISNIFLGLFKGDIQNLSENFEISHQCQSESWTLTLVSTNSQLEQFIKKIDVVGNETINTITLFETNNDKTVIELNLLKNDSINNDLEKYFELQ